MSVAGPPPTQVPTQPPTPVVQLVPPLQAPGVGIPSSAFLNVRIIADEINNALVIQSTPQEYDELKRTIEELDMIPRQVLIDAQIYDRDAAADPGSDPVSMDGAKAEEVLKTHRQDVGQPDAIQEPIIIQTGRQ